MTKKNDILFRYNSTHQMRKIMSMFSLNNCVNLNFLPIEGKAM